jgi:hypothetical protein
MALYKYNTFFSPTVEARRFGAAEPSSPAEGPRVNGRLRHEENGDINFVVIDHPLLCRRGPPTLQHR